MNIHSGKRGIHHQDEKLEATAGSWSRDSSVYHYGGTDCGHKNICFSWNGRLSRVNFHVSLLWRQTPTSPLGNPKPSWAPRSASREGLSLLWKKRDPRAARQDSLPKMPITKAQAHNGPRCPEMRRCWMPAVGPSTVVTTIIRTWHKHSLCVLGRYTQPQKRTGKTHTHLRAL